MAHLSDGTLRRMVDDPDARAGANGAHVDGCAECQSRLAGFSADARSVAALLAVPDASVDVTRAFERVRSAPAAQPKLGLRLPMPRPGTSRRFVFALAAVVAGVALLGTVVAQDLKTNYQPQTVQTVPVTVADIQSLSKLAEYGTITWTEQPNLQVATSAPDAESVAGGLKAPVVSKLPAGVSTNITYGAMPQAQAVFTFSAEKAAASAAAHGKAMPKLPAGMDGAKLTVTVGPAIGEIFGNLREGSTAGSSSTDVNLPQLLVGVTSAPSVTSTQVSVQEIESYILAQPGVSPELASAIKAIKNPSSTLVIPIPVQYATSKNVTVQGVPGVALGDNTGVGSGVIWVKNGRVYAVAGTIKQSDAIDIANNLK